MGHFVVSGVTPSGWHKNVQDFIPDSGSFHYIAAKRYDLAEVGVQEAVFDHGATYAVFNGYRRVLRLVGAENPVPDVEQIAIIGIHIHRVARMVYPVK